MIENIAVRTLEEGDSVTANYWLEGWRLNPLPIEIYPDKGLVMFNEDDGNDFFMGFVWTSNSQMAQIGFITRNPYYKERLNKQTRKKFISALISYAKNLGYEYIITWAENEGIVKDCKELGFIETSNKVSELIVKI